MFLPYPIIQVRLGKHRILTSTDWVFLLVFFFSMWKAAAVKIVYLLALNGQGHVISDKLPSTNVDLRR